MDNIKIYKDFNLCSGYICSLILSHFKDTIIKGVSFNFENSEDCQYDLCKQSFTYSSKHTLSEFLNIISDKIIIEIYISNENIDEIKFYINNNNKSEAYNLVNGKIITKF